MEKRIRIFLFLICVILFLLLTPFLVLYSQGYRIDWEEKKITQTGGIFIKVVPKQVDVYLNSKFKKKTDFFFGSALIENLIPREYRITVKKEGFYPWEKILEVKEKEVTSVTNIILFPENISFELLTSDVEDFWSLPREKFILKTKTGEKNGWALKLYDVKNQVLTHLIKKTDIHPDATLLTLSYLPENPQEITLEIGMKEKIRNFLLDISKTPPTFIETKKESELPKNNILTFEKKNGNLYYLDKQGNLFKSAENFETKTRLTETSHQVLPETEYELEVFEDFIFLKEGEKLYIFDKESKSFKKFFQGFKNFKLSPDSKKLVYFSSNEIWIFYLKDKVNLPLKNAGTKDFLLRLSEKIKEVSWLDSYHLIFTTEKKVKIAEIDNRDRVNVIEVAEFEKAKIFFNKKDSRLYLLSRGKLYRSSPLLP